ncbi:hypothetical protein [Streptomyces sp. NPDC101455]|uniref:hypothetical protein n=1 Tax=Streptomyces sp. NPDC101455 TaxID=3366142 RepID=UPI003826EDCB
MRSELGRCTANPRRAGFGYQEVGVYCSIRPVSYSGVASTSKGFVLRSVMLAASMSTTPLLRTR